MLRISYLYLRGSGFDSRPEAGYPDKICDIHQAIKNETGKVPLTFPNLFLPRSDFTIILQLIGM